MSRHSIDRMIDVLREAVHPGDIALCPRCFEPEPVVTLRTWRRALAAGGLAKSDIAEGVEVAIIDEGGDRLGIVCPNCELIMCIETTNEENV